MRMLCLLLAMPTMAAAQVRPKPASDARLVQQIDRYVAPLAARELSGTLLVARGNRVLVERSFGFSNYELRTPFTPETPTNVASITKPLTSIITRRLAEAGKLSLDDTVSRWLPQYVHGARMTVTQLLGHQAGVPHRLLPDDKQGSPRTAADMVQAANSLQLLFNPGAQSVYSSGGYAILAALLESVSGRSYDELLQEYVAKPVSARTIRHVTQRDVLPGRASSVLPAGAMILNAPLRDLSFLIGGGSVYTTPRDLYNVMQGLLRGAYGPAARSALVRENGLRWNGVTNGFRAFADWNAADSLTVIFAGNAHTGAIDLLRREIPRMAAGESVTPAIVPQPAAVALTGAARARLEGNYEMGGGAISPLQFVSPSLAVFGDRALLALDDTTLFSFADYARVVFASAPGGAVNAIEWGAGTWGTGERGPRFARAR